LGGGRARGGGGRREVMIKFCLQCLQDVSPL
jgi:hypothetical protein